MSHHHSHSNGTNIANIKIAFFLNLFFTVFEIIGGYLTNSVAIAADALHDFGDSLSLGLSWFLEKYSLKGRSQKFSYGYRRFSLLSALINSLVLIIGSAFVLWHTIPRLFHPQSVNVKGMLLLAIGGILINGIAVLKIRNKNNSLNEKTVSWHLLEDVLGWVAVLIISIVNSFKEIAILDPLLATVFTLLIAINIFRNLKRILMIFLQSAPDSINIQDITDKIKILPSVISVHDAHIWTLNDDYNILSIHVVVSDSLPLSQISSLKCAIRQTIGALGAHHITIEIEIDGEECSCKDC